MRRKTIILTFMGIVLLFVTGAVFGPRLLDGPSLAEYAFSIPRINSYKLPNEPEPGNSLLDGYAIHGNTLYLDTYYGLRIVDISNPLVLKETVYKPNTGGLELFTSQDSLYIIGSSSSDEGQILQDSIQIFDISNPLDLLQAGEYLPQCEKTWCIILKATVHDNFLYAIVNDASNYGKSSIEHSLRIVDISNRRKPVELVKYIIADSTSLSETPFVSDVKLRENDLYIARGEELFIIDVSNPSEPNKRTQYSLANQSAAEKQEITSFAFKDDHIYLLEGSSLRVIDFSDIHSPKEIAQMQLPGRRTGEIEIKNDYAYIANMERGLRIVDISQPSKPKEVAHYTNPSNFFRAIQGIQIIGDYAYVNASEPSFGGKLDIVDISKFILH